MNLYIYGLEKDFAAHQLGMLKKNFEKVVFLDKPDFILPIEDQEPKTLALDPDITGWNLPNETIAKIPNLRAICLQTTGYEWVDR